MAQAPNTLSHSVKQSKLAVFPKRPQKRARRVGRATLQSTMRDRLRAYRADDPQSSTQRGGR